MTKIETCGLCCCGVEELHGIRNHNAGGQDKCLKDVFQFYYKPERMEEYCSRYNWHTGIHTYAERKKKESLHVPAFLVFTDIDDFTCGDALMALIIDRKLGEVTKTEPGENPNSGNEVTVYVWRVNRKAFLKAAREAFPSEIAKPKKAKKGKS